MDFGVFIFATDYTIDISELAKALEDRGFESLFVPEHTHIPTSRKTPHFSGELPKEYIHTYDPFVSLSFAAAATSKLRLGTGICLVPQRDPFVTAKCVASLDRLSGGRFVFGIGGGWNVDEMENHGATYETRFKLLRERILAMKAMWTEDEAAFHGEMVDFDPVWSYPKPVQKPHPPIIMGAASSWGRERVARYCDGWIPLPAQMKNIEEELGDLEQRLHKHGRQLSDIEISFFWAPENVDKLKRYRDMGIDRAILACPADSEAKTLKLLDQHAALMAAVAA